MPFNRALNTEVEFTPKYLFEITQTLRKYNVVHVEGNYLPYTYKALSLHNSKSEYAQKQARVKMNRIEEYMKIYRTLYSLHMGLGNTLSRLYEINEEEVIPPLMKRCLEMTCDTHAMENIPIHECFSARNTDRWVLVRMAYALCGCSIQSVRTQGLRIEKLRLTRDFVSYIEKSQQGVPISIRIPSYKNTYHVCTSYSCSGFDNIAMGFIEVGLANVIEKIVFAYYSQQRLYVLPLIESQFFVGKRYPVSPGILESFKKHMFYQYEIIQNTIGISHISYITEALIVLLNPSLV